LGTVNLCDIYEHQGNREKALETINRFPDTTFTRSQEYENFYERGSVEWWHWIHKNIYSLSEDIIVKFRNCALYSKSSPEERIKQFFKAVDFIKLLYEDCDYGFANYHLCELYIYIANRYIEMADYDNASKYLDLGLSHAKQYDELPDITKHTSFWVKDYEFESKKVYSGFEGNGVMRELDYIDTNDFYNAVRETDWFKEVLNKSRPYAKNSKK
jgi:tetratricopeptide (TPR) repeat protein